MNILCFILIKRNSNTYLVITPDILHPAWNIYTSNAFGTGLFEISDFTIDVETVLTVNPDCWKLNTTITSDPALDFERRFGDFSNIIHQLRIRIIPDRPSLLTGES